uniref:Odorant receptor n=1 Tax=Conopomorpha sinensis TaxID=940481 RepID=A0A3S7SGT9_9NEOP|nr:putative odorant receptor 46 [Conopomorpha sinensis]
MKRIKSWFQNSFEDKNNPVLGPSLKLLHFVGLQNIEDRWALYAINVIIFFEMMLTCGEAIELLKDSGDLFAITENLCVSSVTVVCMHKIYAMKASRDKHDAIISGIAYEEHQLNDVTNPYHNSFVEYKNYAHIVVKLYFFAVYPAALFLTTRPLAVYLYSEEYHTESNETVPKPFMISIWYPFDSNSYWGYRAAITLQGLMIFHHASVIYAFDSYCFSIWIFFKGHLKIIGQKSIDLFTDDAKQILDEETVSKRFKECHRHHIHILKIKSLFNSMLSPVMFGYVIVYSICLCSCVVQLVLGAGSTFHKLCILGYTGPLIGELFLFCWHVTDVVFQHMQLSRDVFMSDWWAATPYFRKQLHMFANQLSLPVFFTAGPFTMLSLATFIELMKGSYSFYTVLTRT